MSSKNEIKTALERAEFLINRNKENIKKLSDHIDELTEKKKALEIQAEAAADAGDFNGCKNIRKSIQEVTAEIDFFKDKLEHLKTKPLAEINECETTKTKIVEEYNAAAAEYAKHGFKLTYHNHSYEFVEVKDGKSMMDLLVEGFDKNNISFVLDTCWVANAGCDVCAWLEKLAGRVDILHLKDLKVYFADEGRWAVRQQLCEIGNGNLAWDRILRTAEATGVKHIVVEQDNSWIDGDPFKSLEFSRKYLDQYLG